MTTLQRWPLLGRWATLALVGLVLATLIGACGGSTPTPAPDDPYTTIATGMDASYDRVKLQIGVKTSGSPSGDVTIPPEALQLVVDSQAGKGMFTMSLPTAGLGISAAELAQIGVTGDTLDLQLAVDSTGVYAKSPIAATLLPAFVAQTGQTIDGDLTGWLRLATVDDLTTLAGSLGQLPEATPAPSGDIAALTPAELKTKLEEAGVVLTFAGTEQRNGVDARHVTVTLDIEKLKASELVKDLPAAQLSQLESLADQGSYKVDLWFNAASGALAEVVLEVVATGSGGVQFTILISDPGAVAVEIPTDFTEVPLVEMLAPFLQMFGGGLPTP